MPNAVRGISDEHHRSSATEYHQWSKELFPPTLPPADSDIAVLDVLFGKARPEGKLPFELPSSMEAVRNQNADVPYDSENPLYDFGFGLSY